MYIGHYNKNYGLGICFEVFNDTAEQATELIEEGLYIYYHFNAILSGKVDPPQHFNVESILNYRYKGFLASIDLLERYNIPHRHIAIYPQKDGTLHDCYDNLINFDVNIDF